MIIVSRIIHVKVDRRLNVTNKFKYQRRLSKSSCYCHVSWDTLYLNVSNQSFKRNVVIKILIKLPHMLFWCLTYQNYEILTFRNDGRYCDLLKMTTIFWPIGNNGRCLIYRHNRQYFHLWIIKDDVWSYWKWRTIFGPFENDGRYFDLWQITGDIITYWKWQTIFGPIKNDEWYYYLSEITDDILTIQNNGRYFDLLKITDDVLTYQK